MINLMIVISYHINVCSFFNNFGQAIFFDLGRYCNNIFFFETERVQYWESTFRPRPPKYLVRVMLPPGTNSKGYP